MVNGLSGKKLGANKKMESPKHRASTCKALLLRRFRALCLTLPQNAFIVEGFPSLEGLSYSCTKRLAVPYNSQKASFMQLGAFQDWVVAPSSCESFNLT